MALSDVAIVNDALVMLGADRISSLTQNHKNASVMNAVFERVRDACLRRHPWSFAVERASVAADAAETLWGGLNKFPKPADFVRLIRDDETGVRPDWKIEGRFIITAYAAPLEFKYIKRVTNPSEFDPLFAEYFAIALAVRTCKAITGSTSQAELLVKELRRVTMEARQVNAFEHDPEVGLEDDWIIARR